MELSFSVAISKMLYQFETNALFQNIYNSFRYNPFMMDKCTNPIDSQLM